MSLKPSPIPIMPEDTARVAQAAFPKGNPYLLLRDQLGVIFTDEDFADLFPQRGQPALAPWRLALVTVLQFRENLSDRQAAEAVRARIDWKYLLGLELSDAGFDFSVLSEFRDRLLTAQAEQRLLDTLLECCRHQGLLKARGQQRTDSTSVFAAIRVLNRLELVSETLRAALNKIATVAPDWLRRFAPPEWYKRYGRRIEDDRLPQKESEREAYARTVGEDGFTLLDALEDANAPLGLKELPEIETLRLTWQRHYQRETPSAEGERSRVRFKANKELPPAATGLESPYDPQARFRTRNGKSWTGYIVHVSESCEEDEVHLITHVHTTPASVHEAQCTEAIQQALVDKGLPPEEHIVDSAYVDAALLLSSQKDQGITLVGPTRANGSWQARVDGAYDIDQFVIDWEHKQACCPQGKHSSFWGERTDHTGMPYIAVVFSQSDCSGCVARSLCTKSKSQARRLKLQRREEYEALQQARQRQASAEGKQVYKRRAGIEGTISQGVRGFDLRHARYRGLAKTHLQQIATAAAMNIDRLFDWFQKVPRAKTRTSRFAALAP